MELRTVRHELRQVLRDIIASAGSSGRDCIEVADIEHAIVDLEARHKVAHTHEASERGNYCAQCGAPWPCRGSLTGDKL